MNTPYISTTGFTITKSMKNISLILLWTSIFIVIPAHCLGTDSYREDFHPEIARIDSANITNTHFAQEDFTDNVVYIPDTAFLHALIDEGVDTNGDSLISYAEAESIKTIDVSGQGVYGDPQYNDITSMRGIEAFINLDTLLCVFNHITGLNLANNKSLKILNCDYNELTGLDITNNTHLTELTCGKNQLNSLDITKNINLIELRCRDNQISNLDISNNPALSLLDCGRNQIEVLDIPDNVSLTELSCFSNDLTELDVSSQVTLTRLNCSFNKLTSIDVTRNTALIDFLCSGNPMANIDVTHNINLKGLWCYELNLTSLDVSKNPKLTFIGCMYNELTSLDISNNTELIQLSCWGNSLNTLDVSNNQVLETLQCSANELGTLDVSNNKMLSELSIGEMPSLHEVCVWTTPFPPEGFALGINGSPNVTFTTECLPDLIVTIPDTAFLHALIENGVDTNGDGVISYQEAEAVTYLDVRGEEICNGDSCWFTGQIASIEGIGAFSNLEALNCIGNNLTSLDLSNHTSIERISCDFNQLSKIDVSGCDALYLLECSYNQLTSIDVSTNMSLLSLSCGSNLLSNLDLSNNTNILGPMVRYSWSVYPSELGIANMPTLSEVCVWEGFHPDSLGGFRTKDNKDGVIDTTGSPNVHFTSDCLYDSIVFIPDTAFLHALIDEGVDTNGDGLISYDEAEAVTELDVSQRRPADMTGIDAFVNLDSLSCDPQELNKLILSNNTQLKYLHCDGTLYWGYYSHLEILDISNNPLLKVLDCSSNPYLQNLDVSNLDSLQYLNCISCILNSLDISNCGSLKYLYCGFNQLTSLDVSNQTALIELHCEGNQLINLDISGNTSLREINLESMENLEEVCVWETPFPPEEVELFTWRSPNIYYTTNCQMNIVSIPDTAFLNELIDEGVDTNGDGQISYGEATSVTELDVSGERYSKRGNISNMSGIEAFINLVYLNCSLNELTSLDVSNNTALSYLNCRGNRLDNLDITKNKKLTKLECWSNELTSLDASNNPALDTLHCSSNNLSSLDILNNTALTYLDLDYNEITSLDLSDNIALTYLSSWSNQLSSLDVSQNTALTFLDLYDNRLSSLDISNNPALTFLHCGSNQLTDLDISNNTSLEVLHCWVNQLTSLDVSINVALMELSCSENQLSELDVSKNTALTYLSCSKNQLTSLDVSNNTSLQRLWCSENQLTSLDVSNNTDLESLWCFNNQLTSLDVSKNVALIELNCRENQLTSLDVSKNVALIELNCRENSLTSLDVSKNTSLTGLDCSYNQLSSLDVTNNINLSGSYHPYGGFSPGLYCFDNQITSLDISKNTDLYALDCHNNQLSSLDISNNINLRLIDLSSMTFLGEVCVWESFTADSSDTVRDMDIITSGSTGICFQTDCNGLCSEGVILSISVDTIYQPMNFEATSSADGMIYLVPVDTDVNMKTIRGTCMDSVEVVMNTPVSIPLEGLENGTYWLFATDASGNISEPTAFTFLSVGIDESDARSLRIYPNPTYTLLTIETFSTDLMNVKITSMNGQLMLDQQVVGSSHQLDLSSFRKGVYFITLSSKEFTITRKIIKL